VTSSRPVPRSPKKLSPELKELKDAFGSLSLKAVRKVVPDRIYSLAVHPDPQKDLCFVGDKTGHLGIFDATRAAREDSAPDDEDEDEEDSESKAQTSWAIRAHAKNSVSCLHFDPVSPHVVRRLLAFSQFDRLVEVAHSCTQPHTIVHFALSISRQACLPRYSMPIP
jgi:hypothetical protein